jgi:hypothetical protein
VNTFAVSFALLTYVDNFSSEILAGFRFAKELKNVVVG